MMAGLVRKPEPVSLFVGLIYRRPAVARTVTRQLIRRFGKPLLESPEIPFRFTDYYELEMGTELRRRFIAFRRPVSPDKLAAVKRFTVRLEKIHRRQGKRTVNLDPGYLNESRVVLASTKDFSHRVYLSGGIYAEVTFLFRKGGPCFLPWTYPDYRSGEYQEFFRELRNRFRQAREK